jgi:type IV pilus assembly protein PilB
MPLWEDMRELVLSGASANEIKRAGIANGMQTLRQSGLAKVKEGTTTLEEVMRVTMAD